MKQVNSIEDDDIANEDLPRWECPSEYQSMVNPHSIRDLREGTPRDSYQVEENVYITRRYGLRSVQNPTKMVVEVAGKPMMVTKQLTNKFHCAYFWRDAGGPKNFAAGFTKKYGIELEMFMIESRHVLSDVPK